MDVQTCVPGLDAPLGRTVSQAAVHCEIPLPDGRDAGSVLSAAARVLQAEAVCSTDSVTITGRLEIHFLCRSQAGEAYGFSASSDFSHTLGCEGASAEARALVSGQVVDLSARPDAANMKLSAVLEFTLLVSAPVATPFLSDIRDCAGLQKRRGRILADKRALLGEANVSLAEEADASGVVRVLLCSGTAGIEALSYGGSSVCNAEGRLHVTVVAETETGECRPMALTFPFACSFDAPYLSQVWAEAEVLSLSATAADVSFGVLDVAAELKVRLYGTESTEYDVLLDAYDAGASFVCRREEVCFVQSVTHASRLTEMKETVAVPKQFPDPLCVVYTACMPIAVSVFEKNDRLHADAMLLTSVVCRADDGRLYGFQEDVPIQICFDAPYCPESLVSLVALDVSGTVSERGVEVSYRIEARALCCALSAMQLAVATEPVSEPCFHRGAILYYAEAGETVWDVCKRFHVPPASLGAWNAELKDPLAEGASIVLLK